MQEHIVFVVEKPGALRSLAPHLSKRWSRNVYAIITTHLGLYEFRYRRGLVMADFPFIGEPAWKPRSLEVPMVFEVQAGLAHRCVLDPTDLLRTASSIWFANEPNPSGVMAFHVLLSECLGESLARASWPALCLRGLDERGIINALDGAGATGDDWFESMRNAGIARRFFDFNYNVNAIALFGPVLRKVNSARGNYLVSKYGLQLLYSLRDRSPAGSETALLQGMQDWQGTGGQSHSSLGSPASRPAIIEGLRGAGLIDGLGISIAGQAFLELLHPDCCDPGLPARLGQWEQNWPTSRPKMERYLRTFFGKQKRFTPRSSSPRA